MASSSRRRLAGGVLLSVAALAFYFGMQFKGPGLGGSGSGDGGPAPGPATQPSTSGTVEPAAKTESDIAGDEAVLASTKASEPTAKPVALPLVTVIIAGDQYLLSTSDDLAQAAAADLAEIARAAGTATGDGQGIRVRIFRKKDATAGAKLDLFSKLNDTGIPSEAIQDMKEFLD